MRLEGLAKQRLSIQREAREGIGRDRLALAIFLFGVLSILSQASLILTSWGKLPLAVPLFYSRPWGEAILAAPLALVILPVTAAFCLVFNYLVVVFSAKNNLFIARILIIFSFLVSFLTLYGSAKIITLVR